MLNLFLLSAIVGVVTGFITFIFGSGLNYIVSTIWQLQLYNLLLIPFVGLLTVYLKRKFPQVDGSTVNMYHATNDGRKLSLLIIPYQIIMTWLSHLCGASVGREGVAVQLGAAVANSINHHVKQVNTQNFTALGMAAGFAGLFGTPLAATVFSIEVTKRKLTDIIYLIATLIAAIVANLTSANLGLNHFHFAVSFELITFNQLLYFIAIIIFVAAFGTFFAYFLSFLKKLLPRIIKNEYTRIVVFGVIFAYFLYVLNDGRYMSLGTNLIDDAFYNSQNLLLLDPVLKLLLTCAFISIGFQGGEVTPLFAIGASLGGFLALTYGLPVAIVAACCYGFLFAHATNAYYASFFLVIEVFSISVAPYALIALVISLFIAKRKHSIYPQLNWE